MTTAVSFRVNPSDHLGPAKAGWGARLKECAIRGLSCAGAALGGIAGPLDRRPTILMYHRVAEPTRGVPRPTINVSPAALRAQLRGLLRRGHRPWTLSQMLACHAQGKPIPERTFAVTFDDGYQNMLSRALPVLRDLEVPATVFVCTAFIGGERAMPFDRWGQAYHDRVPGADYRPLNWSECERLLASGLFEIGAHTHTHRDFRDAPAELAEDLGVCVEQLRERLGIVRPTFAFPFGRVAEGFADESLVEAARGAGVRCSLTTACQPIDAVEDPFHWGRFNVFDWDGGATLNARLSGWYDWAPRLARRLRGGRQEPQR